MPPRTTERPERAQFKPISPDINIPALIQSTPNFEHVHRIDARHINSHTLPKIEALIYEHVLVNGLPVVIENWHLRTDWPSWIFNLQWLIENHGKDHIDVRDLNNYKNITMTFGHYLNNLGRLAKKFSLHDFDGKQQRLYGKDLDCPPIWRSTLSELLPQSTFYLSETADLMSSLPPEARAENMMCYIGHEGTYTPAHKEMCATLGQNIMVAASTDNDGLKHGAAGRAGSSIWFMTERDERHEVAEYWRAYLGHDIEVESHFASMEDLAAAPFTVYVVEQKVGDYILVPPLAPHQVWNRGEWTVKAAWNRTTVETLELAIHESLPKARLVCRDEQYKCKAIVYETLCKYAGTLHDHNDVQSPHHIRNLRSLKQLGNDFVKLLKLFHTLLLDQCVSDGTTSDAEKTKIEKIDNEFNVTCSFCRCNIWNRFLTCSRCLPPKEREDDNEDCYDVCLECYARGRSCGCLSGLSWVEQYSWNELLEKYEEFRQIVIGIEGGISDQTPQKLFEALAGIGRKTVARVCFEQLKARPFYDINKSAPDLSDEDAESIAKKKKNGSLLNCHVCKVVHESWKSALCSTPGCKKSYCFGNLWRAFDLDPCDDVLVKFEWKCPFCLGICSCGACRKNPKMQHYEPKGTYLGSNTKHVADPRSVEILVDFSRGNLTWLKSDHEGGAHIQGSGQKRKRTDDGDSRSIAGSESRSSTYPRYGWNDVDGAQGEAPLGPQKVPIDPALSFSQGEAAGQEVWQDLNMRNEFNPEDHPNSKSAHGGGQYLPSSIYDSTSTSEDPGGHASSKNNHPNISYQQYHTNQNQSPLLHHYCQPIPTKPAATAPMGSHHTVEQHFRPSEVTWDVPKEQQNTDTAQNSRRRFTLPSPSAMLIGARPPEQSSEHGETYNNRSIFNCTNQSTNFNYVTTSTYGSSTVHDFAATEAPQGVDEPQMSALERNPMAFIAAAGLMQLPNEQLFSSGHHASPSYQGYDNSTSHASNPNSYGVVTGETRYGRGENCSRGGSGDQGVEAISQYSLLKSTDGSTSSANVNNNLYHPSSYSISHSRSQSLSISAPSLGPYTQRQCRTSIGHNPLWAPINEGPAFFHGVGEGGTDVNPTREKRQRQHNIKVDNELVRGDVLTASVDVETQRHETMASWVKEQKKRERERKRWAEIKRQKINKSRICVLSISKDKLRKLDEKWESEGSAKNTTTTEARTENETGGQEPVDKDIVTTDLHPSLKPTARRRTVLSEKPEVPWRRDYTAGSEASPKNQQHNSARKRHKEWTELSDDKEEDGDGEIEEGPPKRGKRESTWLGRARQEGYDDGEFRAPRSRIRDSKAPRGSTAEHTSPGPLRKRGRVSKKGASPSLTSSNIISQRPVASSRSDRTVEIPLESLGDDDVDKINDDNGMGITLCEDELTAPVTKKKGAMKSTDSTEELSAEKGVVLPIEQARLAVSKQQSEQAEIERRRIEEAERKKKKDEEEASLSTIEAERRRKEEAMRAYRESKMLALKVAAGEMLEDAWPSISSDEEAYDRTDNSETELVLNLIKEKAVDIGPFNLPKFPFSVLVDKAGLCREVYEILSEDDGEEATPSATPTAAKGKPNSTTPTTVPSSSHSIGMAGNQIRSEFETSERSPTASGPPATAHRRRDSRGRLGWASSGLALNPQSNPTFASAERPKPQLMARRGRPFKAPGKGTSGRTKDISSLFEPWAESSSAPDAQNRGNPSIQDRAAWERDTSSYRGSSPNPQNEDDKSPEKSKYRTRNAPTATRGGKPLTPGRRTSASSEISPSPVRKSTRPRKSLRESLNFDDEDEKVPNTEKGAPFPLRFSSTIPEHRPLKGPRSGREKIKQLRRMGEEEYDEMEENQSGEEGEGVFERAGSEYSVRWKRTYSRW